MRLADDFKDILSLLNARQIEYLVIGRYAVVYHGVPPVRGTLELWISDDLPNTTKVLGILRPFGVSRQATSRFLRRKTLKIGRSPVWIELISDIEGLEFADCYSRRVEGTLDGVRAPLISSPDLKRNPKAYGRARDPDDRENLP